MSFTLSIFLYTYYAFLFVWAVFFAIALYHMFKFGFKTLPTYLFTIFFASVAVMILVMSFELIHAFDWNMEVKMLEGMYPSTEL